MGACTVTPYVKHSDGTVVESKLFNDLFSTFKDRGKAWKYYGIATNPKFLKTITQHIDLDSNGEITMESFFRVASLRTQGDQAVAVLEKSLGLKNEKYSYEDAIAKINSFNRHNTEHPGYMATMILDKEGSYTVHIVQRNSVNKEILKKTIKDKLIIDKINEHLEKAGVAVNLNAEESKYLIREDVSKTADGLCELIDFCKDDGSEVFAEEAGHFVIGAATGTPLYDRLMTLLDKVDIYELFSEQEVQAAYRTDNPMRELAGRLVGQVVHKKLDQGPVKNLIDRIFSSVKRFFANMSSSQIRKDLTEIDALAEDLAESFLGDNIQGSLANALNYLEKRDHTDIARSTAALNNAITSLDQYIEELKALGEDWLASVLQDVIIDTTQRASEGIEADAGVEGIVNLITQLSQMFIAERDASGLTGEFILESNPTQFIHQVGQVAPSILRMKTLVNATTAILKAVHDVVQDNKAAFDQKTLDVGGIEINPHFAQHYNTLQELTSTVSGSFATILNTAAKRITLAHLKFLLGADYIQLSEKLLWSGKTQEATQVSIEDLFDQLPETNQFWMWLGTVANSKDVIAQLYDNALQQAQGEANRVTESDFHKLKEHEKKLKEMGLSKWDQRIFYEKDVNGKLTNNLITEIKVRQEGVTSNYTVRWSLYEEEYLKFRQEEKKKWMQENKDNIRKLSKLAQKHLFERAFDPIRQKWLRENAIWDYHYECFVPSPFAKDEAGNNKYVYDNPLTKEQKQWLKEYRDILADIDSRIQGHRPVQRAPQFSATFINLLSNKIQEKGAIIGISTGLWQYIKNAIHQENDPEFFGSEVTYNSLEDAGGDSFILEEDKPRRLALFGINKIKDTSNMSTDLISSTIAYAAMANKNSANSKIEKIIRIGMHARQETLESQLEEVKDPKVRSRIENTNRQLRSHVDKLLYSVGMSQVRLSGLRMSLNNIARALSMFASKLFLGGNISGGLVNAGTGILEMYKEAFAGEDFTTKELNHAINTYFLGVGGAIGDHFAGDDKAKLSLFGQRYQISSSDEYKYMNYGSKGERIAETLWNDFFMLPYSIGEHFMQTVPFIVMAQKKMLYKADGTQISLWDALTVRDFAYQEYDMELLNWKDIKTASKTLQLSQQLFNEKEGSKNFQQIIGDLDLLSKRSQLKLSDFSTYTQEFFKRNKILHPEDIKGKTLKSMLKEEAERLVYSNKNDIDFQRKVRNISIKMHGVYNSTDKTMAQRTLYGSMLLTMRGYALGLIEKNWGTTGYRAHAEHETEGAMITLGKIFKHALLSEHKSYGETGEEDIYGDPIYRKGWKSANGRRLLWYASLGLFAKERAQNKLKEHGVADFQYRNLRRALFARLAAYVLSVLWVIGMSGEDDDDETWNYTSGMLRYFSSRLLFEQVAFTSRVGIMNEVNSTNFFNPVGMTALSGILETIGLGIGALFIDEYDEDSWLAKKVRYKKYKGEKDVSKAGVRLQKMLPYYKEVIKWQDWHDASENYLHVREQQKKF